jgi:WD40 repeat protein
MAVVQSIGMESSLCVTCSKNDRFISLEIRLASTLSPNGRQICVAKHGGYDLYNLDSGIVLHTFAHGLHPGVDKYPATFLPGGFVFCGATNDGTVTIWDSKEGDRLQSVQHLRAFILSTFYCHNPDPSQAGVTLHTLAVRSMPTSLVFLGLLL